MLAYTLQLYCDFSGIMDVVGGLAEMMGIKMPDNFRRPFFAKSINEFWQRWHITLGQFLRDYIFSVRGLRTMFSIPSRFQSRL